MLLTKTVYLLHLVYARDPSTVTVSKNAGSLSGVAERTAITLTLTDTDQ